jgi:hypothetical protein
MKNPLIITVASALVLALAASPASASRPPRVPPPLPHLSTTRAPTGAHARVQRLPARTAGGRRDRRAVARSLPPVTRLNTWSTGAAAWGVMVLQSNGLYTPGVQVSPPSLYETNVRPGDGGWLAYWWQAGVMWWDPNLNQWVQGPTWNPIESNPIDDFAWQVGAAGVPSGTWAVAAQHRYGYVWVRAWWHYGTYSQVSDLSPGGIWYSASKYVRQVCPVPANSGCLWG